jgi:membrane associated rhomboid family serine protease
MNYNQPVADRLRSLIQMRPALSQLIIANVVVWFILQLVKLAGALSQPPGTEGDLLFLNVVISWIGVPASFPNLLLKPWTIITYMFVQEDFWHLFFNMIWLFWFGKIFMEFMPGRKIYTIYFIGGIAGALAFMGAYNIFPLFQNSIDNATTIGASASVLAITIATAVLVPSYSVNLMFIGPVKIKYIALFTVILDVLMIRSGNAGGHFAHIGGAIAGALYILFIRHNLAQLLGLSFLKSIMLNPFGRKPLYKVHSTGKPLSDDEYNKQKAMKQKKIDLILDKISRSGYTSLSAEEKEILFNSSKNQ